MVGPRERLTVERSTLTENRLGEAIETWDPDGTVDVTVVPASAYVRSQGALRGVSVTHTIVTPSGFPADPLRTRLRAPGRVYRLHSVTETPRGTILEAEMTDAT